MKPIQPLFTVRFKGRKVRTNFYQIFLDHCQVKVYPFDPEWQGRAFYRARNDLYKYLTYFAPHRLRVADSSGETVYQLEGAQQ